MIYGLYENSFFDWMVWRLAVAQEQANQQILWAKTLPEFYAARDRLRERTARPGAVDLVGGDGDAFDLLRFVNDEILAREDAADTLRLGA